MELRVLMLVPHQSVGRDEARRSQATLQKRVSLAPGPTLPTFMPSLVPRIQLSCLIATNLYPPHVLGLQHVCWAIGYLLRAQPRLRPAAQQYHTRLPAARRHLCLHSHAHFSTRRCRLCACAFALTAALLPPHTTSVLHPRHSFVRSHAASATKRSQGSRAAESAGAGEPPLLAIALTYTRICSHAHAHHHWQV